MSDDDQLHVLMREATLNAQYREDDVKVAGKRQFEADLQAELSRELYDALGLAVTTADSATFQLREQQWTIWRAGRRWPFSPGWGISIPDYAHEMTVEVGQLRERLLAEITRWEERVGHYSGR
ncbi:MAG: hypothetical protein IVW57_02135 [Ktedonobacterales bacterium]|nr:hypothetical protein [Ktedonobacterales bacterium]